jgi:formylglycine-generating enzyme required for sulfatase activity
MTGNVGEWCLDDFHRSYKGKPDHLKNNGNEPWGEMNTNNNDYHLYVFRGSSWSDLPRACRSADRRGSVARLQSQCLGFRAVFTSSS